MVLTMLAGLLLNSCSKNDNENEVIDEDPPVINGPSVETNPPNTNYKPAFAGQTRIGGMKTTTPFSAQLISTTLVTPWGITSLPDGRLLVTEKFPGTMRIVTVSGNVGTAITGIPSVNSTGQGGLLGLCIDPNFSSNRMIYWVFAENVAGGSITAVAKGKLAANETAIEGAVVIYRSNSPHQGANHFGGRILFDRTGNLMVSIGERSDLVTRPLAQSYTSI